MNTLVYSIGLALVYLLGLGLARSLARHAYDEWDWDPEQGSPEDVEHRRRLYAAGLGLTAWVFTPVTAALVVLALLVRLFGWLTLPQEPAR